MDIKANKNIKIAAVAVAVAVVALAAYVLPFVLSGAPKSTVVVVAGDEPLKQIYEEEGSAYGSRVGSILSILSVDLSKRQGGYAIDEGESPLSVARKIRNHNQVSIKFTFHNIRTKEQFAERAAEKFYMSKDEVLALLNDSTFCNSLCHKTPETVVSVLIPDTYEFYYTVAPKKFLHKIAKYYDKFWTDERKAKAAALGLTPDEVSTIASIVEEETAKNDERGMVARLYINRYKSGMKLQADPTVKFAIGDFSIKRITHEMLFTNSPYNTYKFAGLPPGPIRLPERSTLDAVLNAPQHSYTYMCAKEDFSGYHNFTSSYAEHQANAAKYQAELNKRGIK